MNTGSYLYHFHENPWVGGTAMSHQEGATSDGSMPERGDKNRPSLSPNVMAQQHSAETEAAFSNQLAPAAATPLSLLTCDRKHSFDLFVQDACLAPDLMMTGAHHEAARPLPFSVPPKKPVDGKLDDAAAQGERKKGAGLMPPLGLPSSATTTLAAQGRNDSLLNLFYQCTETAVAATVPRPSARGGRVDGGEHCRKEGESGPSTTQSTTPTPARQEQPTRSCSPATLARQAVEQSLPRWYAPSSRRRRGREKVLFPRGRTSRAVIVGALLQEQRAAARYRMRVGTSAAEQIQAFLRLQPPPQEESSFDEEAQ